jgi:hypothetical protein
VTRRQRAAGHGLRYNAGGMSKNLRGLSIPPILGPWTRALAALGLAASWRTATSMVSFRWVSRGRRPDPLMGEGIAGA